uniref:Uncharacterized protein n=1 Tax=Arundo donax TaxID=35708 RepID=A0A0A8ZJR2_ARUDO
MHKRRASWEPCDIQTSAYEIPNFSFLAMIEVTSRTRSCIRKVLALPHAFLSVT